MMIIGFRWTQKQTSPMRDQLQSAALRPALDGSPGCQPELRIVLAAPSKHVYLHTQPTEVETSHESVAQRPLLDRSTHRPSIGLQDQQYHVLSHPHEGPCKHQLFVWQHEQSQGGSRR